MRKADLTADQIFEAEKASDDRRQRRAGGFQLMKDRDAGQHVLSNGVEMLWHVERPIPPEGSFYQYPRGCSVPEDCFVLTFKGEEVLFNKEEFSRWLRWA